MTHKVRTTKRPWLEVEVSDKEYLDLERQGLVYHPTPEPAAPAAAPKKSPAPPASGVTKED